MPSTSKVSNGCIPESHNYKYSFIFCPTKPHLVELIVMGLTRFSSSYKTSVFIQQQKAKTLFYNNEELTLTGFCTYPDDSFIQTSKSVNVSCSLDIKCNNG